jgi:hypothetical protein
VIKGFGHFALIEAEWEVVWANRVLVIVGQLMTESLTQSYLPNQSWRLWSILYLTFIFSCCRFYLMFLWQGP